MTSDPVPNPDAATSSEDASQKRRYAWLQFSSLDLLKIIAGLAVLTGLVLHLVGAATHEAYLRAWGIDSSLFAKPIDQHVIRGYGVLVASGLGIWPALLTNIGSLIGWCVGIALYWSVLSSVSQWIDEANVDQGWLARLPRWVQLLIARFIFVLGIGIAFPAGAWLLSHLLASPFVVAERHGRAQAEQERSEAAKGCQRFVPSRCLELRRGAELVVGKGLLLDSSAEQVAIYDLAASAVRILPRQGTDITVPFSR